MIIGVYKIRVWNNFEIYAVPGSKKNAYFLSKSNIGQLQVYFSFLYSSKKKKLNCGPNILLMTRKNSL